MRLYPSVPRWQRVPLLLSIVSLSMMGCGASSGKPASTATTPTATTPPSSQASSTPPPAVTPTSSDQALSPSAAIAQADAICTHLGRELNAADKAVNNFKPPGITKLTAIELISERAALAQLSKLKPVPLPHNWRQYISDRHAIITILATLHHYASRNEARKLKETYIAFDSTQAQMLEAAKHAGLQICPHVG